MWRGSRHYKSLPTAQRRGRGYFWIHSFPKLLTQGDILSNYSPNLSFVECVRTSFAGTRKERFFQLTQHQHLLHCKLSQIPPENTWVTYNGECISDILYVNVLFICMETCFFFFYTLTFLFLKAACFLLHGNQWFWLNIYTRFIHTYIYIYIYI